ncbi:MAG: ABC transporter substrate-binding protein, partial [Candidatus Thorarchaeota archaeon]
PRINPFSIEGELPYSYYDANIILGNQTLDNAGFIDSDDDGYREAPDGSDFNVRIELAQGPYHPIVCGLAMAEGLQAMGIDAESTPTDFYEYLNRLRNHEDYDMVFIGKSWYDFNVDWLAHEYSSDAADKYDKNYPNFRNASYDAWCDQLLYSINYEEVYEAAQKMQEIFVYECPIVICYENILLSAYRTDRFEGFVNDVSSGVAGWWTNQKVQLKETLGGPIGGTFRWSNPLDVFTFNFMSSHSAYTMNVVQMLYDGLLRYDPQGNLVPWLAESYTIETHVDNPVVKEGNTRFTFEIVKKASWSDGTPLTAQDVAFSYNYYREGINNPYGDDLNEIYAAYAPTEYTFIIEFQNESYWYISKMTKPIIPKHIFVDIGLENWSNWDPSVGNSTFITSGPFYVSEYVPGEFVELTANEYYFKSPSWSDDDFVPSPAVLAEESYDRVMLSADGDIALSWTANDNPISTSLSSNDIVDGDHVVVNASYIPANALNITLEFQKGFYFEHTRPLVIPDPYYYPDEIADQSQYSWMTVSGIEEGDMVRIFVNFTNSESGFMAWWEGTDSTEWEADNNILEYNMYYNTEPEELEFIADRDGALTVACFDWDRQSGNWTLIVNTTEVISQTNDGNWITYDTYEFGENETYDIRVYGYNSSDVYFEENYISLTFNNFFAPHINLLSPVGGEVWTGIHNITWSTISRNRNHEFNHEVFISNDAGASYQLYAAGFDVRNTTWDTDIWQYTDQFMVKVRAIDREMVDETNSNSTLTAGSVIAIDTVAPYIVGMSVFYVDYTPSNITVSWLLLDIHPDWFSVYIDNELSLTGSWSYREEIKIVVYDLPLGGHNFTIHAADTYDNAATLTTIVIVSDELPPEFIGHSENLTYHIGSSGNILTWAPRAENPQSYVLSRNDVVIQNNEWNGSDVSVNVDGLGVGTYFYNLVVNDTKDLIAEQGIGVTVFEDTIYPLTDSPDDVSYFIGDVGNQIVWNTSDEYPILYEIHRNDTVIITGQWNDSLIFQSIDGLGLGTYEYTLKLVDIGGNSVTDTVMVSVVERPVPVDYTLTIVLLSVTVGSVAVIAILGSRILWTRYSGIPRGPGDVSKSESVGG